MYRHEQVPFTLQRDVEAIMVPAGVPVTLRADKTGFITQALGGSFTVYIEGNLFRIPGKDADALGQEVVPLIHSSDAGNGPALVVQYLVGDMRGDAEACHA